MSKFGKAYKRDQVERAIAAVTGRIANADRAPDATLKIDLKRLMDFDRLKGIDFTEKTLQRYAFFDGPPPGRGIDLAYPLESAFALLVAERLIYAGLTQSLAVRLVRLIRDGLDQAVFKISKLDLTALRPGSSAGERAARIMRGTLVEDIAHMVFLVTLSGGAAEPLYKRDADGELVLANICFGPDELTELHQYFGRMRRPIISLELVNMTFQLQHWLEKIPVRTRGRS
jgi:hypothetical protein